MAEALAGDIAAATRDVHAAHNANPSLDGVFGVDVARADVWLHAARGELTAAARSADHAAELAASRHHPTFEALALHDVARFAPAPAVAERLVALAGLVDGTLVDAMASHARGLADDDAALLDEAARRVLRDDPRPVRRRSEPGGRRRTAKPAGGRVRSPPSNARAPSPLAAMSRTHPPSPGPTSPKT